jgi:hypothetical protein
VYSRMIWRRDTLLDGLVAHSDAGSNTRRSATPTALPTLMALG